MSDPLLQRALDLLGRGHRLYGGETVAPELADAPARLQEHAERLARVTAAGGLGPGAPIADRLIAGLRRTAAVDADLAVLLADAHVHHQRGRHATRAVLDDARADTVPAADTALGRREALRRMAARLRAQHRHIRRSRRTSRELARQTRQLTYRRRGPRPLPLSGVRYERSFGAGHLRQRINRALDRLGITDRAARRNWLRGYQTLIARESGGRASAIAAEPATAPGPLQPDGRPLGFARGITQTLPATFAHYHQPGTSTNVYDPVANICASMNYVMHRYGVRADGANLVALVQQADFRRAPKGY